MESDPVGRFVRVPQWWLTSGNLNSLSHHCAYGPLILLALIGHVNRDEGVAWPSDGYLANECGVSEASVKKTLGKAQQLGMIDRRTRRFRRKDGKWGDGRCFAIVQVQSVHGGRGDAPRPDASRDDDRRHQIPEQALLEPAKEQQAQASSREEQAKAGSETRAGDLRKSGVGEANIVQQWEADHAIFEALSLDQRLRLRAAYEATLDDAVRTLRQRLPITAKSIVAGIAAEKRRESEENS